MSLGSDAEGSRRVVVVPGVPSNEDVRRVGGHGHDRVAGKAQVKRN